MSMINRLLFVVLLSCLMPVAAAEDDESKSAQDSIVGTWGVTKTEASGKSVELAWTWIFKSDGKASLLDRKAGTQAVLKYAVDRTKVPQQITIEYLGPDPKLRGSKQLGILEFRKEMLVMHLNHPEAKSVPTGFKTAEKSAILMEMEFMPTE